MKQPHAVIIAGGRGERLGGVRKAELRIGGVRQIDRVIAVLGGAALPLMLATGPSGQQETVLGRNCLGVSDLESPCAGPLAGLAAAVAALAQRGEIEGLLVSVAVDTPFLPADFVPRLIAGLGDGAGAYAAWGDDFYPPNAIWRLESLQGLPDALNRANAPASLKALQRSLGAHRLDWAASPVNPFANINTLDDLLALQRAARM